MHEIIFYRDSREIEKAKRELADFKKRSGFYEGI